MSVGSLNPLTSSIAYASDFWEADMDPGSIDWSRSTGTLETFEIGSFAELFLQSLIIGGMTSEK